MKLPTKEKFLKQVILENIINKKSTNIVDATCGNGYDLEFLVNNFTDSNVFAIDIQKKAIDNSKNRCKKLKEDIIFLQMDHEVFFEQQNILFDLVIFNTGYLPNSNKVIKTDGKKTVRTLMNAKEKLKKSGLIILMIYTAHDNYEEQKEVDNYLKGINKYEYIIFKYEISNVRNSPILYLIEKK